MYGQAYALTLVFPDVTLIFVVQHRGVEQLVARWAHNPKATGSSPVPATTNPRLNSPGFFIFQKLCQCRLNQVL